MSLSAFSLELRIFPDAVQGFPHHQEGFGQGLTNMAVSETSILPDHDIAGKTGGRDLLAAIGIASFASLLLELALTRLFSVVLFYHFAFLAISIALLGLGAGGVFAYIWRGWLARWTIHQLGTLICAINAIAVVAVLEIVLHVPVSLELGRANFAKLTVIYLAAAVPFFFTGLLFSLVFARESHRIAQLYGADLVGGALSCLAVVPLLNWLGGPNAVVFSALAMASASVIWAGATRQRKWVALLACALALLLAANYSGKLIDIVYAKGKRRDHVVFARWNAISRVEVVDYVMVTKDAGYKSILIDADASTTMRNADPHDLATVSDTNLMNRPPALANVLRPRGAYAIIGPGGGVDVLRAVANGSPNVTGIEINPLIANTIMRGRYADYVHHLYQIPEVHMHVGDGRSWIRSSRERYDVLQMTLVDTWAATAAGALALSENNLYTIEAFREYFDHLKPDGFVAITRWEFKQPREALRVVSQAMEALHRMGVEDTARNLIVVSDGPLDVNGRAVTVLAKKSPFTPEEEAALLVHLAGHPDLVSLYTPSNPGRNAFSELIQSEDPRSFATGYAYNIAPVSDNAPFFFFTFKTKQALRAMLERTGSSKDWKNNIGVAVLGMLLLISVAAVLVFLILPLLVRGGARRLGVLPLLYFVAVGLGYITVEIVLIQRFVLFLGHPTYALTVVVFLMLLSSGVGSVVSRAWLSRVLRVRWILGGIIAAVVLHIFILPLVLVSLVGLHILLKLLLSTALLVPLGFLMGMPFPTGLRALAGSWDSVPRDDGLGGVAWPAENTLEWAWAMNAAASVLGSVLAMVLAVHFGLNVALACAAGAYLSAMGLTFAWQRLALGTATPL